MGPKDRVFWCRETLDWYLRAAQYGDYHKRLAQLIAPWLRGSVCDMGCGLGCLALELLRFVPQVTALDMDGEALASLRQRAEPGLVILEGNAMSLPRDMVWDTLVLSYFGWITEPGHLDYFFTHCGQRIVSIVSGRPGSSFSATGSSARKKEHVPQVEAYLKGRGIRYHLEEHALEFGQPLRDMEEARDFVRSYSPKGCQEPTDEELAARLRPMENGGLYLPYKKHIGIFVIEREQG